MRSQSLVNRLLAASLFSASCVGTLALFGAVPLLPRITARLAGMLPDLSEFALNDGLPQPASEQHRMWLAQLPEFARPQAPQNSKKRSSLEQMRYRSR